MFVYDDANNVKTSNYTTENADLPKKTVESVAPRRSTRSSRETSSSESVKVIRAMGSEHSKVNATVELKIEEDKVTIEGGEVYMGTRRKLITESGKGDNNSRHGKAVRNGQNDASQAGNSKQKSFTNDGRMQKQGQKLGALESQMAQGSGTGGRMRRRQVAEALKVRNKAVEIITLIDTDDEEESRELEEILVKMFEKRNWKSSQRAKHSSC